VVKKSHASGPECDVAAARSIASVGAMKTALIAGASGLVGRHLLDQLLAADEYDRVVSVGRRTLPLEHPKLRQETVDFAALEGKGVDLACDDAFCCLGTTIRQAGSQEKFRAVDHVAVLALAWAVQRRGAQRFLVVTAMGADARSRVFYNRVKGETEEALQVLDFGTLAIFRPSLLLGKRPRPRLGERVFAALMWLADPLMFGPLRKYRAIRADVVARAMLRCSFGTGARGLLVFPSDEIEDLGGFGS
jgi:uncharacterized protein YbjT (DUF2867 family)